MDNCIGYDEIRNLYYTNNTVFYKKNEKELWQYQNIALGKATKMDYQNQLKILLFYENFNTVILLDNQLNESQKINFSQNEIPILASATGIAAQNRIWIYNSLTQQIGLFDFLKNSFQTITPPIEGKIQYYETDFNTLQWIDTSRNWYRCDLFGKISFMGKLADFDQIQILSKQEVLFCKDKKIYITNTKTNLVYIIENVDNSFRNFYYKDQILSIFTDKEILNYKIIIP
jgi:hypothetical protein